MHIKDYEEQLRLYNELVKGKQVSQLELAIAGIKASFSEINAWREIAKLKAKRSSNINRFKHLPSIIFSNQGLK